MKPDEASLTSRTPRGVKRVVSPAGIFEYRLRLARCAALALVHDEAVSNHTLHLDRAS